MFTKNFKIVYHIFLGLIAVIAVLVIISALPIPGNYRFLVVESGSMAPAIKTGSLVCIKPISDYKVNDIITFGPASKTRIPITHRIYEIKIQGNDTIYITKGDTNKTPDMTSVAKKDIIGKALFAIPYVGYAVNAAKKPLGFALILIVPALVLIYDEMQKIRSEMKKIKNKKSGQSQDQEKTN